MSELKAFDVGLGQYCEDGSPCVVAFDADRNPRLLNEKVYLKSEADKVIADLEHQLQAADEQVENLINSASSIMLSQDKVNDNKCKEIAELKDRIHKLENMPHTDNSAVIELLENQNVELREATRWRKCSEEMPEDDSDVLATDGEGIWLCYKTTMPDGLPWFQPNGQPHIEGVTHWMPLPKAPKEEK